MSTWDIVDIFDKNEEVVSTKRKPTPFRAVITSAVRVVFVVTLAVGSTTQFTVQKGEHASTLGAQVKFADPSQFVGTPPPPLRRRVVLESDTQVGQSTVKLAQLFETYFAPADDEEPFEDDYSFS